MSDPTLLPIDVDSRAAGNGRPTQFPTPDELRAMAQPVRDAQDNGAAEDAMSAFVQQFIDAASAGAMQVPIPVVLLPKGYERWARKMGYGLATDASNPSVVVFTWGSGKIG